MITRSLIKTLAACFLAGTIGGAWWLARKPTRTYTAPPDEGGWVEEVPGRPGSGGPQDSNHSELERPWGTENVTLP